MRARSHSGRLRLWPFPLEMASVRARSHSERFNSLRLRPCDPARMLGAEVAFVRARSHFGRANSPRCRPREPARILGAGGPFVRARSHSGRASSPRCRSREPARFMTAEVAFVRAQLHSLRVNSSLPASASSFSYPERVSSPILSPCFKMLRNIYSHWVGAAVVQAPRM